jgi:hypothetical protein
MSYQPTEQAVHDRINLLRLVRALEKSVNGEEWLGDTREPGRAAWIKTQGALQVRLCFEVYCMATGTNMLFSLK